MISKVLKKLTVATLMPLSILFTSQPLLFISQACCDKVQLLQAFCLLSSQATTCSAENIFKAWIPAWPAGSSDNWSSQQAGGKQLGKMGVLYMSTYENRGYSHMPTDVPTVD